MTDHTAPQQSLSTAILSHFRSVDPILAPLITDLAIDIPTPQVPEKYFEELCAQIIGQQLSGSVADVIFGRFTALFPENGIVPEALLKCSDETLRSVGMSRSKVRFLQEIAHAVSEHRIDMYSLSSLSDHEVIRVLTAVKGIGPWTAEMFLMFTLGRPDVFSFGDLGLKRAIQRLYAIKKEPTQKQMERLSNRWRPYRTYAALALWKYKDG